MKRLFSRNKLAEVVAFQLQIAQPARAEFRPYFKMLIGLHYTVTIELEDPSAEASESMKRQFARLGFAPCVVSPEVGRRDTTTLQFHGNCGLEFIDFDLAIRIMVQDVWKRSTTFIAASGGKYVEDAKESCDVVGRTG
jgi:hypothetical protein